MIWTDMHFVKPVFLEIDNHIDFIEEDDLIICNERMAIEILRSHTVHWIIFKFHGNILLRYLIKDTGNRPIISFLGDMSASQQILYDLGYPIFDGLSHASYNGDIGPEHWQGLTNPKRN